MLDGVPVSGIRPTLSPGSDIGEPNGLETTSLWGSTGVDNSKGESFVLESADSWLPRLQQERPSLVRPYVTGEDLGTRPVRAVRRWVVDTGDADLDEIRRRFPTASAFLESEVRPSRSDRALKAYPGASKRWWQFVRHRADFYRKLREHDTCVVMPKVALFAMPTRAPTSWCFTNKVIVIGEDRPDAHSASLGLRHFESG